MQTFNLTVPIIFWAVSVTHSRAFLSCMSHAQLTFPVSMLFFALAPESSRPNFLMKTGMCVFASLFLKSTISPLVSLTLSSRLFSVHHSACLHPGSCYCKDVFMDSVCSANSSKKVMILTWHIVPFYTIQQVFVLARGPPLMFELGTPAVDVSIKICAGCFHSSKEEKEKTFPMVGNGE